MAKRVNDGEEGKKVGVKMGAGTWGTSLVS